MPEIRHADGTTSEGESVVVDQLPDLGLVGRDLVFIRIDHQVRLQVDDTEVVIECPFRLTSQGDELTLDPQDRKCLGPLLALYPTTVEAAEVAADRTLRLAFVGGSTIEVPQDSQHEAWHLVGPEARLIVCPPEGTATLAVWR